MEIFPGGEEEWYSKASSSRIIRITPGWRLPNAAPNARGATASKPSMSSRYCRTFSQRSAIVWPYTSCSSKGFRLKQLPLGSVAPGAKPSAILAESVGPQAWLRVRMGVRRDVLRPHCLKSGMWRFADHADLYTASILSQWPSANNPAIWQPRDVPLRAMAQNHRSIFYGVIPIRVDPSRLNTRRCGSKDAVLATKRMYPPNPFYPGMRSVSFVSNVTPTVGRVPHRNQGSYLAAFHRRFMTLNWRSMTSSPARNSPTTTER